MGRVHKKFEQHGLYDACREYHHKGIQGKNCLAEFSYSSPTAKTSASEIPIPSVTSLENAIKKFLVPSLHSTSSVGICVPKICSNRDLTKLGNSYLTELGMKWKVHHCEKPLNFGFIEILVM